MIKIEHGRLSVSDVIDMMTRVMQWWRPLCLLVPGLHCGCGMFMVGVAIGLNCGCDMSMVGVTIGLHCGRGMFMVGVAIASLCSLSSSSRGILMPGGVASASLWGMSSCC